MTAIQGAVLACFGPAWIALAAILVLAPDVYGLDGARSTGSIFGGISLLIAG